MHERDEEKITRVAVQASRKARAFVTLLGHTAAATAQSPRNPVGKAIKPACDMVPSSQDPISDESSKEGQAIHPFTS